MPACFGYESRIRDHWTVDPDIEWFAAQQASDSRDWRRRASCKLQQIFSSLLAPLFAKKIHEIYYEYALELTINI